MSEEEIHKEIDKAASEKDLGKIMRLTGLPPDVITGQRVMLRKERREWYRENKKRLKLPEWNKLAEWMK